MINIIAAIQKKDNGLGFQNELLFRLKDDLKNFKALTLGQIIIMGRKTYDSIGQPLPGRTNFVITKNIHFKTHESVFVFHSLKEAIQRAREFKNEIFIIGGGEIYKQSLYLADRLYLTIINSDKKADIFFPDYSEFKKVIEKKEMTDEKTKINYKILILEK